MFVSSRSRLDFYARSASEAGEADVRPKRGEPIGHSCKRRWSEKRASDGDARPETGASTAHDQCRSRTCTLDALHVRRTSRFRRALGLLTAEDSTSAPVGAARCVARACSPRECDQCRPPRSARATCRATRRAVRPPTEHTTRTRSVRVARELTSRGRCPARRVLAPAPRQIDASAGHLSEGQRTSRKDGVGKIRPSFGGPRCRRISNLLRIPRANQNRDLRKIFIAGKIAHCAFSVTQMRKVVSGGSLSHEPRMIPTAKIADSRAFGDRQRKPAPFRANRKIPIAFHRTRRSTAPLLLLRDRSVVPSAERAQRANEKSAGPVANHAHRPVPRVSPDRARLAARSRPLAAPARTHAVAPRAPAPPSARRAPRIPRCRWEKPTSFALPVARAEPRGEAG